MYYLNMDLICILRERLSIVVSKAALLAVVKKFLAKNIEALV